MGQIISPRRWRLRGQQVRLEPTAANFALLSAAASEQATRAGRHSKQLERALH